MKRIISFLLLLCFFITPIYANENPAYEIMPVYENVIKANASFVINNVGGSVVSLEFDLKENAQSICIETKIQKRFLLVFWNDVDGGQWTDSFTSATGSFKHTLQLQKTGTYRAVFHIYAVGTNGSIDDFELTKEYDYE